jgi:hypothetical protein
MIRRPPRSGILTETIMSKRYVDIEGTGKFLVSIVAPALARFIFETGNPDRVPGAATPPGGAASAEGLYAKASGRLPGRPAAGHAPEPAPGAHPSPSCSCRSSCPILRIAFFSMRLT